MPIHTVKKGLTYLLAQQQKDGSFLSRSSEHIDNFEDALTLHPTFPTSLILSCVSGLEETPQLKKIKHNAASFLLSQKNDFWSFNYWARQSKEASELPYPDDLDDTFCALSALFHTNPDVLDGTAMASIVTLLTTLETEEGGPYRTWLVQESAPDNWKDVDLAVNSNIAYFLSLLEIDIPNMTRFVESAITTKTFSSPYYYTEYPLLYFIARFYKGKYRKTLQEFLLSKKDKNGSWGNPLHTALAVSALLNLGTSPTDLHDATAYLVAQQTQGVWQPYAFYVDPTREGKKHYAGSSSLTTAFCIEALGKYVSLIKKDEATKNQKAESLELKKLHKEIVSDATKIYRGISPDLEKQAEKIMQKIVHKDASKQITLLPAYVTMSMQSASGISTDLVKKLGTANLLGWIAYTLFDNFIDEEGDPKTISVATIALRNCVKHLSESVPHQPAFEELTHKILDGIDRANMWELNNCRIPMKQDPLDLAKLSLPDFGKYEKLAERSLGHALAPLGIFFMLGHKETSPEVTHFLAFFTHYIIAKQLLDDAHDFEKDLKKGHITPVVKLILEKIQVKEQTISLKTLHSSAHEIFWYDVVVEVCEEIMKQTNLAEKAIKKVSLIQDDSFFKQLLASIEASAQKALTERENTLAFLKSYQK